MKARGFVVRSTVLALVVMMAAPMGAAHAGSRYDELQQQIRDTRSKIAAKRAQENNVLASIAASDARRQGLEGTIAGLNSRLRAAGTTLARLNASIALVEARVNLAERDLEAARARLDDQQAQIDQHAAQIYIHGTEPYTTVLLGTNDFHEFASGMAYTKRLIDTELGALDSIERAREDLDARRAALSMQRVALRIKQDDLTAQARAIGDLRNAESSARDAVLGEISYRQQLLSRIQREKQQYINALNQMLAESASIEALLNGAQSGQQVIAGAGHGYMVWPTSGRITSPYGWRIHPIYHYRSFHTGIDIGAPSGQGIIAARRGEVLYVGYKDAYGLMVIIDHGNRVATVYAHLSRSYVHVGQVVSTRQLIAAVGSTGWSTGPHLHFEIRVNGEHVNPIRYL